MKKAKSTKSNKTTRVVAVGNRNGRVYEMGMYKKRWAGAHAGFLMDNLVISMCRYWAEKFGFKEKHGEVWRYRITVEKIGR